MRIMWFSFEQSWIPFTQGCFVSSLVEIGSVVLEKNIFFYLSEDQFFKLLSSLFSSLKFCIVNITSRLDIMKFIMWLSKIAKITSR